MLTNKQLWRKQRQLFQGMNLRRSFSDDSNCGGLNSSMDACTDSEMSDIGERNSSASFDSISGDCSPELPVQYSRSVEDLNLPPCTLKKIQKKLRFDNLVRVTLIPSINEYKDAGLHLYLWCSQNELQCYKDSAYEDIKEYMRESHCDNFTVAMKSYFKVESEPEAAPPLQPPAACAPVCADQHHPLTPIQEGSPGRFEANLVSID